MKKPRFGIVRVSDHALLRFLDRAGGMDVETLRASIEGSLKRAMGVAAEIGTGDMVINADGLQYIVRNNVVVTVVDGVRAGRRIAKP